VRAHKTPYGLTQSEATCYALPWGTHRRRMFLGSQKNSKPSCCRQVAVGGRFCRIDVRVARKRPVHVAEWWVLVPRHGRATRRKHENPHSARHSEDKPWKSSARSGRPRRE